MVFPELESAGPEGIRHDFIWCCASWRSWFAASLQHIESNTQSKSLFLPVFYA